MTAPLPKVESVNGPVWPYNERPGFHPVQTTRPSQPRQGTRDDLANQKEVTRDA